MLIITGAIVVIGANLFIGSQPELMPPVHRDATTVRSTSAGPVVGFRDKHGARAWLGIPYAAPPTNDRHWRAPAPPVFTPSLSEALLPQPPCPQFSTGIRPANDASASTVIGSEDCLYLNIWSPPNAVGLPVMYWIHGGGNTIGQGGKYNGAALAANREVVVVTINYRLGVFGWFSHPALSKDDPLDDSGNYGTLDTIRGLQWVQENIARFGGDPGNVTVFGESAGAFNTLAVMASPLAAGLFHRAIVQSGGFPLETIQRAQAYADAGGHPNSARELVTRLLIADGTVRDRAAARVYQARQNPARLKEYLYRKTPEEFFAVLDGRHFGMIDLPYMFRDGHVLPDMETSEIFSSAANHNVVPTILGTNRDEPSLFMFRNTAYVNTWLGILPRLKNEGSYTRQVRYGGLAWKLRGADDLARHLRKAGNPDVYVYRFDWDEEPNRLGFDLSSALGAAHALEIAFIFGDFENGLGTRQLYPGNAGQLALSNSMMSYWSEFAYSGNPGKGRDGTETHWLPWSSQGKYSLILDTPDDQGIFMDDEEVTMQSMKKKLAADTGFSDPADQCATYVRSFRGIHFKQTEYESLNSACTAIDPKSISAF